MSRVDAGNRFVDSIDVKFPNFKQLAPAEIVVDLIALTVALTSHEFYSDDRIFIVLFRLYISLHSSCVEVVFFVFTGNRPAWIVFRARCKDGQIRENSKGLWDLVVKIVKVPKSKYAKVIFVFNGISNLYAKLKDISLHPASKSDLISCSLCCSAVNICFTF